jgi:hypothetical protein
MFCFFSKNTDYFFVSCYEFKLYNDFTKSFVTNGLSPLPICVLENESLNLIENL